MSEGTFTLGPFLGVLLLPRGRTQDKPSRDPCVPSLTCFLITREATVVHLNFGVSRPNDRKVHRLLRINLVNG